MLAGLRTVSVPTTSIATIENGELKETPLKCHDSTYNASFNELVNVERFAKKFEGFCKETKANAMDGRVSKVVNIHDCLVPQSTG